MRGCRPYLRIYAAASPKRFNVGLSRSFRGTRRRRRESPAGATPRRRLSPTFPPLPEPRREEALAGRSSPPAGATRAGRGARGSAPASRARAPPRGTELPPVLPVPPVPPSSPGRKPEEGDRASVSARTGGAGRPRSAAGPAPPAAARRSPARAARRTRAVATRAGIPTASTAFWGPLRAVSSQERRGGTRAPAVSTVVSARGRASTPRRTTHMAPRTCRAGSEGRGAEARSRTGVFRRHRKLAYLSVERSEKRRCSKYASCMVAAFVSKPRAPRRGWRSRRVSVRPSQPRCPA